MEAEGPMEEFHPWDTVLFCSLTITGSCNSRCKLNLGRTREEDSKHVRKHAHNSCFTSPNRALEDIVFHEVYRLSPSYTKPANPYLIKNANTLPAT